MNIKKLTQSIKHNEGFSSGIYLCTAGKRTIGFGRNLDDVGISAKESEYLLESDIKRIYISLNIEIPLFDTFPDYVQNILIEMAYQMGVSGLLKFKNTLKHIKWGQYDNASAEMLNSKWANQTPMRAKTLSNLMKGGF